ncbi:DUF401 family protein [Desulfocurvibacter africanus]|uniref:DUF401 family protein n=1 Tax=Desulfocurvibacter africanus subsp. africanus str. Walvis Bay TaxID=690850 RepID=F3YXR6_DESAF|nr:DUF401 family protein [Desulfocurvibacter africanus]EGJ49510.1 protein of unknown function DUF401 [Desulfocurvibacter africanus subsp. africanus str. Walvis Bay]
MDTFAGSLPLIKLFAVFAAMLAGIRYRLGLWPSVLGGSLLLGLAFGMPLPVWLTTAGVALTTVKTLLLAVVVILILVLSDILELSGQNRRLMDALSGYLTSPRLRLAFFPSLIGLLPMPGGAVFSAPMLGSVAEGMNIRPEDKVMLNYWFRHMWELIWPLYPGIILASSLSGVPLITLIAYTLPGMIFFTVLGWWFLLRPSRLPLPIEAVSERKPRNARKALLHGLPLLVAIVGSLGLEGLLSAVRPDVPYEWGIIAGLATAIAWTMLQNGLKLGFLAKVLLQRKLLGMLLAIASIFVFKDVMAGSGVVETLSASAGGAMAMFAASVLLPYLVGLVSGITMAFVGATFPLMLGLLQQAGAMDSLIPYMVLSLFSGFLGVMSSPLHICYVLSCQYFEVGLGRPWRKLLAPCALLMAFAVAYFSVLA